MSLFSKSKLQSFLLSVIIIIAFYLFSIYNSNISIFDTKNIVNLLIGIVPLFIFCFFIIYFYLEFFVLKKIRNLYKDLIPIKETKEDILVTTNMDELVYQLKKFSKESEIEIKSMQQKENFRRDFIGNLAHELKTPLFTSQSYLLTLIDGALKDEEVNLKYLKIEELNLKMVVLKSS
jgi:two-component system, OmpR family, phosphate regulon sensor histidine kinase PhoR